MTHITPYSGNKFYEVEGLYRDGGRTWIFNPNDLAEEDRDNEWLINELVREQTQYFKEDWWTVRGFLELGDPWTDEEGRTVLELLVTDRFLEMRRTLRQGAFWNMVDHCPDYKFTKEVIRLNIRNNQVTQRVIDRFQECQLPELDDLKKEVILFKLSAVYDKVDRLWRSDRS